MSLEFVSCGPSEAEKAAEKKAYYDSLVAATQRDSISQSTILDSMSAAVEKTEKIRIIIRDSASSVEPGNDD